MTEQLQANKSIEQRLRGVQAQIAAACAEAGRSPDDVTLVAVSKTHPPVDVLEAAAAGVIDFGENRLEEAVEKIPAVTEALPPGSEALRWHMIGHIQSRKARLVVPRFDLVHSVDSVKLAEKLSRLAAAENKTLDVLLEINVSGEPSKYGWQAATWADDSSLRESLWEDIQSILELPGLHVRGLMTMAPIVEDMEQTRPVFANLRRLRDAFRDTFSEASWDQLSMGMTDDYPVAIQEGATILRIGRAIFGPRLVK